MGLAVLGYAVGLVERGSVTVGRRVLVGILEVGLELGPVFLGLAGAVGVPVAGQPAAGGVSPICSAKSTSLCRACCAFGSEELLFLRLPAVSARALWLDRNALSSV